MTGRLTLCPTALAGAPLAGPDSRALAGGPRRFAACEAVYRPNAGPAVREIVAAGGAESWAARFGSGAPARARGLLERLGAPRGPFAGLTLDRPRIMGILNVTPDSFSDGGDRLDPGRAVADGLAMLEAGADLLDVGGESTRPGAAEVAEAEELRRVEPVVRGLAQAGATVSIDTRHARVMAEALEAGARLVNDVTALTGDPAALPLVARAEVPVVLMHMRGEPKTMQRDPVYGDAPLEVFDFLEARLAACVEAGIPLDRVAVDPGIGFGKTVMHNLQILDRLALYQGLGCAVLLGVSRKSFIARLARAEPAKARLPGSLAAALAGLDRGVQILRVHDVAETAQAVAVWRGIAAEAVDAPG
jgi:dihydropteroate synthase